MEPLTSFSATADDHETEKTIDPLTKDLEENLFISDLFEESAEDSYSDEDSDEDTDEDVYDLPEGDLPYDCNWGEEETDDDEETPRKEPPVCEVCFKDKAHWSGLCPLLDCIPNPRDTTVGENYIIVCQCCGEGGEEGEEDPHPGRNWVGRAIRDPASVFYINPNPDYCPMITDFSEVSTPRKLRRVE